MGLPSINTRADLDAIAGTPEHIAFMALLAGTLWRMEKDDTAQAWVAIEDNSTVKRFGFTLADFPGARPPALPEYVPVVEPTPAEIAQQQIDAIEQKTLMNRAVREGMLATAEFIASTKGVTPALLYTQNDAYKAVKDVDTVISQLRKELK